MKFIFASVHESWIKAGFGIHLHEHVTLTHIIWSDNLFLFAASRHHLKIMFSSLTSCLTFHKLSWKNDSLWTVRFCYIKEKEDSEDSDFSGSSNDEFFVNKDAGLQINVDNVEYAIPRVQHTAVLGNDIYHHGFDFNAIDEKLLNTTAAFYANESVLLCKHASLRKRFQFLHKHVTPVALHGSETLGLVQAIV